MLIDLVCNILRSNGYVLLPSNHTLEDYDIYLFGCPLSSSKEEYFVVIESRVHSEAALEKIFVELADEIFEELSTQENVAEYFKKNSTLIICAEEASCSTGLILSLEEDQYNFKKNVILFTKPEILSMADKIDVLEMESMLTNAYINSLITAGAGDVFRAFKSAGGVAQNYYSLLLKIISKLPFLTYVPVAKSLHDLEGAIDTSMTKSQMDTYCSALTGELLNSDKNFEIWLDQP